MYSSPVVHDDEHHGIPVRWVDLAERPLTGTLTIGVGSADETALERGITHLAEHLVFRALGEVLLQADGTTHANHLEFSATGTPDSVAATLNAIAGVLAAPRFSDTDVALERRILRAERPNSSPDSAGLLTYRFGLGGPGNAHAGEPGLAYLGPGDATCWIRRWATRSNARLTFSGPVPTGLAVRLPDGPVPPRRRPRPLVDRPTLVASEKAGVAVSLLVQGDVADLLCSALEHDLIASLRLDRGLVYSIDVEITAVAGGFAQLDLVLDPLEDDVVETVRVVVTELRRLAVEGISEATRSAAAEQVRTTLGRRAAWAWYIDHLASADLAGVRLLPAPDKAIARSERISAADLTRALESSLECLVVAYDDGQELPDDLPDDLGMHFELFRLWQDAGRAERARSWEVRTRTSRLPFGPSLGVSGSTLWLRDGERLLSIDLTSLALVGTSSDGCLTLIDHRGRSAVLDAVEWRHPGRIFQAVLDRTDTAIRRDLSFFH